MVAERIRQACELGRRILDQLAWVEGYVDIFVRRDCRFAKDGARVPSGLDLPDEALDAFRESLAKIHTSARALADLLDDPAIESSLSAANRIAATIGSGDTPHAESSHTRLALSLANEVLSWSDVNLYGDCAPSDDALAEFGWWLACWDVHYHELTINVDKECSRALADKGRADSADERKFFPKGVPDDTEVVDVVTLLINARDDGRSMNEIAREYTGETKDHFPKAKRILGRIQKGRHRDGTIRLDL